MAASRYCLKEPLQIVNIYKQIHYNREFYKEHPTYFQPDSLIVFVGPQGSGKTLSAVNYTYNLLKIYPNCKLVSNLELTDYPIVTFEEFYDDHISEYEEEESTEEEIREHLYYRYLSENRVFPFVEAKDLKRYKNGFEGVIFLIDEIQLYFNSLGSRNIDPEVMTQISQQRKQRIHIVSTSQVFGRMSKQLREQFDTVIYCEKRFFGYLQKNSLIDRDSIDSQESTGTNIKGTVKKVYRYFKNPESFKRYDTYKVIENENVKVETERNDIYGDTYSGLSSHR